MEKYNEFDELTQSGATDSWDAVQLWNITRPYQTLWQILGGFVDPQLVNQDLRKL